MVDYILADCSVCGRVTDWPDGSTKPPVCVRCFDRGLTGAKRQEYVRQRIAEAKERRADGATVAEIMASMEVSQRTVYRWLNGKDKQG